MFSQILGATYTNSYLKNVQVAYFLLHESVVQSFDTVTQRKLGLSRSRLHDVMIVVLSNLGSQHMKQIREVEPMTWGDLKEEGKKLRQAWRATGAQSREQNLKQAHHSVC